MSTLNPIAMGERIRILRKRAHLTQEQLAEKLDVTIKHISSVERGQSSLSLDKLVMLCEMFESSLDAVVLGAEGKDISIKIPVEIQRILGSEDAEEAELLSRYLKLYVELRS